MDDVTANSPLQVVATARNGSAALVAENNEMFLVEISSKRMVQSAEIRKGYEDMIKHFSVSANADTDVDFQDGLVYVGGVDLGRRHKVLLVDLYFNDWDDLFNNFSTVVKPLLDAVPADPEKVYSKVVYRPSKKNVNAVLEDLHGTMCADVLQFTPTFAFAREVAESDIDLVNDGLKSKFNDTVGREMVMDAVSRLLLGEDWPRLSDNVDMVDFNVRLWEAYINNHR